MQDVLQDAWVQARTIDGHVVVGFIDKVERTDNTAMVCVMQACCDRVGAFAWASIKDIEPMEMTKVTDTEGSILNAIDIALDGGDQEAFVQLTDALRKIRAIKPPTGGVLIMYRSP